MERYEQIAEYAYSNSLFYREEIGLKNVEFEKLEICLLMSVKPIYYCQKMEFLGVK